MSWFFVFLCIPSIIKSQNIESMLNACSEILNNRNIELYDDVENYLNGLDKDSIVGNHKLEILYHANMAFLYCAKYEDWQKSTNEIDYVLTKIIPFKHLPEYRDIYINLLAAYGFSLLNSNQLEKSIVYFNKLLLEDFDNEFDQRKYNAYQALATTYEQLGNLSLSNDCHNQCQEFLVRFYVHLHPEHSFYIDNFNILKNAISQLEAKNTTITEDYITNLCSLGYLLHKVDQGDFLESMLVLQKAHKYAIDNGLMKCKGLGDCYNNLQDIYVKYIPEPMKSEFMESLIPYMINYFSDTMDTEEIYESVAASFGANLHYEKAIEYELKALSSLGNDSNRETDKLKRIYQGLVLDYLGLSTDSANQTAFNYLQKIKTIVSPGDGEYYNWYLDNYGIVLRCLYKNDEAIRFFKNNLNFYKKMYGMYSDQYIRTLNQLALCYPYENDSFISYLKEAKSLINKTNEVKETTIWAISINLARHYLIINRKEEALIELKKAKSIEEGIWGQTHPITQISQELINKCLEK